MGKLREIFREHFTGGDSKCGNIECQDCFDKPSDCSILKAEEEIKKLIPKKKDLSKSSCTSQDTRWSGYNEAIAELKNRLF